MKTLKFLAISLIAVFMVTSCSKQDQNDLTESLELDGMLKKAPAAITIWTEKDGTTWPIATGCGLEVYDLFGGQTIHMGTVSVMTVGEYIHVKYELNEDSECWKITETHVYVGSIDGMPVGKKDNPKIGHFPYAWEDEIGSDVVIMQIPIEEGWECPDIAAHAVVKCGENEETAWAKNPEVIFAIKSKMQLSDGSYWPAMSGGSPGTWCENFNYLPLLENLGKTLDLVDYSDGVTVLGKVSIEFDGDIVSFTITSDNGGVDNSHLFVGSVNALNTIGICYHNSYPYKDNDPADQHVFEFPASILDGEGTSFSGSAWGWYISEYCMGDC